MIDQLIIGDKASFDDFGASVAKRVLNQPPKKSIKETVPFSNITYDFTAINGEIYWEERTLEYIFEMIAPTAERLEEMKAAFANWLMNIIQQELHDPLIPDYHFIATYEDMSFDDDEGLEKTTASVTFSAYPYKIANYARGYEFEIPANSSKTVWIENKSSHRITPTITADKAVTLNIKGVSYSMSAGTAKDETLKLEVGINNIYIDNPNGAACSVSISFYEEVF